MSENTVYDCSLVCRCTEPDWNDTLINHKGEMCVHCDLCGGVPNTKVTEGNLHG